MFCWVDSSICQTAAAPVVLRVLNLYTSKCKRTKTWALLPTMCQALGWALEVPWWVRPSPASRVSVQLVGRETAVFLLKWHERAVRKIHKREGMPALLLLLSLTSLPSSEGRWDWQSTEWLKRRSIPETTWYMERNTVTSRITRVHTANGAKMASKAGGRDSRWGCRGVLHVNWLEFYLFWEWQRQIYSLESPHYSALGQDLRQRNQVSIWRAPIGEE